MIVDEASVYWQWLIDDVLRQPDLVAGCREQVAYMSTSGPTLLAAADTMPDVAVRSSLLATLNAWQTLIDNCGIRYVVSGADLMTVLDYIETIRAPALAIGLTDLAQITTGIRTPTGKTATTPTVYYTPQDQLIIYLNATARALIGQNAPAEIHQEYVETYWAQQASAQRAGAQDPDPYAVAGALISNRLPDQVGAHSFAQQADILHCLISGRTDCDRP